MVSLRDYEICLLFLLLVKFHGSGKCEVILRTKDLTVFFLPCPILSLDIENADPLFMNVIFVKMISELQGCSQQFLYFKI